MTTMTTIRSDVMDRASSPPERTDPRRERAYSEQRSHTAHRLLRLLSDRGLDPAGGLKIADMGCGKGFWLRTFLDWGVRPADACGIDTDTARLRVALSQAPGANLVRADCRAVPFPDSYFDFVTQFTLFTSLLSPRDRIATAKEVTRIVKPGGFIVWYDFFAPNPMNPGTRAVARREIEELFPGSSIQYERVTFAAPLARALARVSPAAAAAANRSDFLPTHYLALIEPPKRPHT